MAQAFPTRTFVGSDVHAPSIDTARQRADEAGVGDRIECEVAGATALAGTGYDLVTTFDALHDMGDPVGAARRVHEALAEDGTWMVVEPAAGDRIEDNFNPVGRAYYGFSTLLCTPGSLVPGRRPRHRDPGRSGPDPRHRDRRRLQPVPDRGRRPRSTTCSKSGSDRVTTVGTPQAPTVARATATPPTRPAGPACRTGPA